MLIMLALSSPSLADSCLLDLVSDVVTATGTGLTCGGGGETQAIAELEFTLDSYTVVDLVDITVAWGAENGLCTVFVDDLTLSLDDVEIWSRAIDEESSGDLLGGSLGELLSVEDLEGIGVEAGTHRLTLTTSGWADTYAESLSAALDLTLFATGDWDEDGVSDEEEFEDGTDPTDPDDCLDSEGDDGSADPDDGSADSDGDPEDDGEPDEDGDLPDLNSDLPHRDGRPDFDGDSVGDGLAGGHDPNELGLSNAVPSDDEPSDSVPDPRTLNGDAQDPTKEVGPAPILAGGACSTGGRTSGALSLLGLALLALVQRRR